jgi:two-component system response regulator HydG
MGAPVLSCPAVRRAPSQSLLGPALLLYLVADASAAQGQLDFVGGLLVVLAGVLSLSPAWLARRSELPGSDRVGALGLLAGYGLVRAIAPRGLSLVVDLGAAFGTAGASAIMLDLAFSVPEPVWSATRTRAFRVFSYVFGAVAAGAGLLAQAPAFTWPDRVWIAPAWLSYAPLAGVPCAVVFALGVRLLRRRRGGTPEALASNAWAILGLSFLGCTALALIIAWWLGVSLEAKVMRGFFALAVCLLIWSHLRLVDPSRRLSVGPAIRDALPAVLALFIAAGASVWLRPIWPEDPLVMGVCVGGTLLATLALYGGLREAARALLAPASGRLLLALERAHAELAETYDLDGVARVALAAARAASGNPFAEPLLYLLDPARGIRVDAAGMPHADAHPMHAELLRALRERPGQIILRVPLEAQIVRMPALRGLIDVLVGLDALCVLPLLQRGELEGALVVPRAGRRNSLTLEEIEALQGFGRHLTGFLAVLCAEDRAQRRSAQARLGHDRIAAELSVTQGELLRLSHEARALRGGALFELAQGSVLAYSAAMRRLLAELERAAGQGAAPILLVCERGLPVQPLARLAHEQSGRALQPFVAAECAAIAAEHAAVALLGGVRDGVTTPGVLRIAADGTLLLGDLPALPLPVQRALAQALRERRAQPLDGTESYACGARVIASCRRDAEQLVVEGALERELLDCFSPRLSVPPLRQRVEDLPSLLLLAIDHGARVLGRPVVGIEPDAQERLLAHDWPGNLDELYAVIELALMRCSGARITCADLPVLGVLPPAPERPSGHPLDGTLERVERRVLARALERAEGNKSEAARLLGLKRTTFLDKLRRYGLDDGSTSSPSGVPPN